MMERGSADENNRIVSLSDCILKTIGHHRYGNSFQIALSALADSTIYVCQSAKMNRLEFKNVCQQLVDQYDEIFIEDIPEDS